MEQLIDSFGKSLSDPQTLLAFFTAVGVFATVVVLGLPLLEKDKLKSRMKSVASEKERIRQRERARLVGDGPGDGRQSLRQAETKRTAFMGDLVARFNLKNALDDGTMQMKLAQAGLRGQRPMTLFLFGRFVLPFAFLIIALIYVFSLGLLKEQPGFLRFAVCLCIAYFGFMLPNIYIKNLSTKRQQSIQRAFPDALDLMLICVESGMSVEGAFKRVAQEVGGQSPELAEELALTTAELSFLQHRVQAYDNLAMRTGLDGVKACALALSQAEKFGTPVGSALRVMAQENRDMRMSKAEEKAASLPPKLTVPMIIFFLPVLFMVIISPAIIQLFEKDVF